MNVLLPFNGYTHTSQSGISTANTDIPIFANAGAANTKGTWTELIDSTQDDCAGFFLCTDSHINRIQLIDIGIGAAASETVILENFMVPAAGATGGFVNYTYIPISIPEGTRVAARSQSSNGTDRLGKCMVYPVSGGTHDLNRYSRILTIGANDSAVTGGTVMDNVSVADTKGAYVELENSTSDDIHGLMIALSVLDNDAAGIDTSELLIDVSVGGSGNEEDIVRKYYAKSGSTINLINPCYSPWLPVDIAAGSRIACRYQAEFATGSFEIVVYGLM